MSWWYLSSIFLSLFFPSVSPWVGLKLNAVVSLQLLDLCVLHMNSLDFQYRVLAASVLSHFIKQEAVEKVTGKSRDYHVCRHVNMNWEKYVKYLISWPETQWGYLVNFMEKCLHIFFFPPLCSGLSKDAIQLCVNWMAPFVESVGCFGRAMLKDFVEVRTEDKHNIQTHTDYMAMLVSVFLSCLSRLYIDLTDAFQLRDLHTWCLQPPEENQKYPRLSFLCANVPLS